MSLLPVDTRIPTQDETATSQTGFRELSEWMPSSDQREEICTPEGRLGERGTARVQRVSRVLLAEDDDDFRAVLSRSLIRAGYRVVEAEDGDAMLDRLIDASPLHSLGYDAIITDVVMPGFSGLEVLQAFRRSTASAALIVMSAFRDERFVRIAQDLGAVAFFRKPFDTGELLRALVGSIPAESTRPLPRKKFTHS